MLGAPSLPQGTQKNNHSKLCGRRLPSRFSMSQIITKSLIIWDNAYFMGLRDDIENLLLYDFYITDEVLRDATALSLETFWSKKKNYKVSSRNLQRFIIWDICLLSGTLKRSMVAKCISIINFRPRSLSYFWTERKAPKRDEERSSRIRQQKSVISLSQRPKGLSPMISRG